MLGLVLGLGLRLMTPWIYTGVSVERHLPLQRATSRLTTPAVDPGRVPGVVWVHSQTFMHASTRDWEQDEEGLHNLPSWSENPHVTLVWGWGGYFLRHTKILWTASSNYISNPSSPCACIKSLFSLYPLPCPSTSWAHTLSLD